jgi:hypothetical protein
VTGSSHRDILPPGHKPVVHEIVLEPGLDVAPWRFVAAPSPGLAGMTPIVLGEPFRFSSKYGTAIWALPADAELPVRFDRPTMVRFAVCNDLVQEVASVPLTSPLARVRTTYRIAGVSEREVCLELVAEQRFDAAGRELALTALWWPCLPIAAIGLIGLRALARRRPSRP